MSGFETKRTNDTYEIQLMKVNQIINSIFAMNQPTMIDQLQTCSKIVSQLLQNQLIHHINSLGAAKLLCYQLVLFIAEQNTVDSKPRLSMMENAFGNNKKIKLTASMRNTLASIQQTLQQMIWKNAPKKRNGVEKRIVENSPLYADYCEFKHLLSQFDKHLEQDSQVQQYQIPERKDKKAVYEKEASSEGEETQALLEQLQVIIAKKEKRIKQLNQELQNNIIQQKAQQDLISQIQLRNLDLKQQIRILNVKLAEKDAKQLVLQQKIQTLQTQNLVQEKSLNLRRGTLKTQKTIKTRFTIDDDQDQGAYKKQTSPCQQCQQKKDIDVQDIHNLRKFLLIQAISIEALI